MTHLALLAMLAAAAGCSANDDVPSPMLSSVNPDPAPPGALVQLTGAHFCQQPMNPTPGPGGDDDGDGGLCNSTGEVHFGAAPGSPTMWSDSAISVEVPAGVSGAVSLTVLAGGRQSNAISFTVD